MYCIVLYCILLYCIVLYCIVLYCIVLYCIVLYCIVLYCIALDWIGLDWIGLDWIGLDWIGLDWIGLDWIGLDWIGLYCIVLYFIVLYCIVLYCIVLYCIVLYCIVLYCIVLYCIVLYCIVLYGMVWYGMVWYCILLYGIVLYGIVWYCMVLYGIVLYGIVWYCMVLCCVVLRCVVLCCGVVWCGVVLCVYCIVKLEMNFDSQVTKPCCPMLHQPTLVHFTICHATVHPCPSFCRPPEYCLTSPMSLCVRLVGHFMLMALVLLVPFPHTAATLQSHVREVCPQQSRIWGPGLEPDFVVPVRWFYIQAVDIAGANFTSSPGPDTFQVRMYTASGARVWAAVQVLDRRDGTFLIRYRLARPYEGLAIHVLAGGRPTADSPYRLPGPIYDEYTSCPQPDLDAWAAALHCPASYPQIDRDLAGFPEIELGGVAAAAARHRTATCHYTVKDNTIHRRYLHTWHGAVS